MADKTQKPPKRMLTPDYTLLDCSTEEMEDYLRSSSRGLEDYSLPSPVRNPSHLHSLENHPHGVHSPYLYLHNTEAHPRNVLSTHLHVREAEREWKQFRIDTSKDKWKWIGGTSILKQQLCERLKYYDQ
ncbi:hypothetical protein BTVI_50953 [Pitangus sulphuratus]|nr:hypothetical protein BTVI_50953 [Pitangus sulphuratus]